MTSVNGRVKPARLLFAMVAILATIRVLDVVGQAQALLVLQAPGTSGQEAGRGRGQGGGGRGGGFGQQAPVNLPSVPTPVTLPTLSAEVTGPGPMFDSAPSTAPGKGVREFRYEVKEYWVSGTANGQPYKTRLVVRAPADRTRFSGIVVMEAMHPSGAAHIFEFTSIYSMTAGHAVAEVVVAPNATAQFTKLNEARYRDFQLSQGQTSEILAQVGSLVRHSQRGPLTGLTVRKMVLGGTSATSATLIAYLPAHMVYRTPDSQRIFDGFLPTSTADVSPRVDVPIVHIPTMNEVAGPGNSRRQDGDDGDNQFRIYEFPGMNHIDTRDNVRLQPNPCARPLNPFPHQAYMSVGLHHLLQWVDKGIVPPRSERIWITRVNGTMMALDEHGNPRGGVRSPYVDVPVASHAPGNTPADPPIANASPLFTPILCGLGGYQVTFPEQKLRQLYGNTQTYVSRVTERLDTLEKAGWSLPVYREMILADARKVSF
jgi:hypothetical protein